MLGDLERESERGQHHMKHMCRACLMYRERHTYKQGTTRVIYQTGNMGNIDEQDT